MTSLWHALAPAVAALLAASAVTAARAGAAPPCTHVAVAPGAVFCAHAEDGVVTVARGTPSGRSWNAPVTALRSPEPVAVTAVVASPRYASDRTVYVVTSAGLLRSGDGGARFAAVTQGSGWPATGVTAFADAAAGVTFPAVALAGPAVLGAQVYADGLGERTVAGAPVMNARFVVADDYASSRRAHVLASVPGASAGGRDAEPGGVYAYACTGDFACAARAAYLGRGALTDGAPLPGTDRSWAQVNTFTARPALWRTGDAGASWTRWSSLERALATLPDDDPGLRITGAADAPRRLFAHVTLASSGSAPYRLFRSDDDGTTWRQVAHGWGDGRRGTLPWLGHRSGRRGPALVAGQGGRLYAAGVLLRGRRGPAFACSADAGRTWRATC